MVVRLIRFFAALVAVSGFAGAEAAAHPHVFVVVKSEIVFDAQGAVTGIRHAWTFDEMYSTYALQDVAQKDAKTVTRAELQPLAELNVTTLKDSDFFTYVKAGGKKAELADAVDYWLEYKESALTLYFTLPLKSPLKGQLLDLEVYDPAYFVDFSFTENDAVALKDAPAQCQLAMEKPKESAASQRLSEAFFSNPNSETFGARFARKVSVTCP